MNGDRQPDWAASIAGLMGATDIPASDLESPRVVGDDPLSLAIAEGARLHEDSIAESLSVLEDGLESTIAEIQRALAIRLDL